MALSLKLPQPQAIRIAREMFNIQEYFVETLLSPCLKATQLKIWIKMIYNTTF